MNLYDCECKLMEVRKYSHEYYDVESKFRHRKLQLALQLPHKWHSGPLSLHSTEKRLYYPTKFAELELIVRNNFCAVGGQIRFYESAKDANAAAIQNGATNP